MINPFELLQNQLEEIINRQKRLEDILANSDPKETHDILTLEQVAELLQTSPQAVYNKVHRRELPFMKQGRKLYFSKKDLLEHLGNSKSFTQDQLIEKANDYLSPRKNQDFNDGK